MRAAVVGPVAEVGCDAEQPASANTIAPTTSDAVRQSRLTVMRPSNASNPTVPVSWVTASLSHLILRHQCGDGLLLAGSCNNCAALSD